MRPIDADILEDKLKRKQISKGLSTNKIEAMFHRHAVGDCLEIVRDMPTVDAEPVRHGRWIRLDRDIAVCSECGRHENALLVDSYPYCHCGAKMDGGK